MRFSGSQFSKLISQNSLDDNLNPSRADGVGEGGVVALGLVGVGYRELFDSLVEVIVLAHIAADHRRVTRACMCAGQRPARHRAISAEPPGIEGLDQGAPL